jgi:3-methyladenine DNA glycosylase AlkC
VLDAVEDATVAVDGWELWPVTDWVALAGRDHRQTALDLLGRLTRHATGEFSIRPFIDDDPDAVMAVLHDWARGEDEHRRRLASEGTRPRLPWAPRLRVAAQDPGFAVPLLDRLVADPSEYVRRSVSNHLNDLTRGDLQLGLGVAERWLHQAAEASEEDRSRIEWVVRRGLRSLVKHGDPSALRLLGYDPDVAVRADGFEVLTPQVTMPGVVEWQLDLVSEEPDAHRVVVDYVVHFVGAAGRTGRKVFKWTTVGLRPGERRTLQRRHAIRPITTRTYRSGQHRVEVHVNGSVVAAGTFDLEVPEAP